MTDATAPISPRRHAVRLTAAAERQVQRGHPWIYDGGIERGPTDGEAGDLAVVFGRKSNRFVAVGLYDPHSPIRIKVLHRGRPVTISTDWFRETIRRAYERRAPLLATNTTGYRLLFGENDGLPGLIADVYAHCLVVKVYSSAWLPYLDWLVPLLEAQAATQITVLRFARRVAPLAQVADGTVWTGSLDAQDSVVFEEHGVRFASYPIRGHKTGFFLDHRHNRQRVGAMCAEKTMLDVFSYAGGFAIHALVGGATEATSLDISQPALEAARQNATLNGVEGSLRTVAADAFDQLDRWNRAGKRFDVVVIDPPAFAKQQREIPRALKKYASLARLGVGLVRPGGQLILASCSSRVSTEDFFATNQQALGKRATLLDRTRHDLDHPIEFPEGSYLKTGYYRVR